MAINYGDGTTIAFAVTGFTANVISINGPNPTRESIDTTHLGTSNDKTFIPAALVDGGDFSMTIQYDPTVTIPIKEPAETITIDPAGSGNTLSFSGFLTAASHSFAVGELMQTDVTGKVTGPITGI